MLHHVVVALRRQARAAACWDDAVEGGRDVGGQDRCVGGEGGGVGEGVKEQEQGESNET